MTMPSFYDLVYAAIKGRTHAEIDVVSFHKSGGREDNIGKSRRGGHALLINGHKLEDFRASTVLLMLGYWSR